MRAGSGLAGPGIRAGGRSTLGAMRHHKPIPMADLDNADQRPDPAQLTELAHAAASLLVYGTAEHVPADGPGGAAAAGGPGGTRGNAGTSDAVRAARDDDATARFVHLADEIGLDAIAEIWSASPAVSLPGVLWRLYALREWIVRRPREAADEFETGRTAARTQGTGSRVRIDPYLAELLAGVQTPPGPAEVARAADEILAGAFRGDFAMALVRAAAFAEVAAAGRWELGRRDGAWAFEQLAADLTAAARQHRTGALA